MRINIQGTHGLKVKAISGTNSIIFGFDLPEILANELMGFTILRNKSNKPNTSPNDFVALEGMKFFENKPPENYKKGDLVSSEKYPFQDFFWSDFTVKAGIEYTYKIKAQGGSIEILIPLDETEFSIKMENHDVTNTHDVYFNRSVAGSQGFSRLLEREHIQPEDINIGNPTITKWLSGGLEEAMIKFIEQATDNNFKLRCAFYEFEHEPIIEKLISAKNKGVDLEIIIHGKSFDKVNTNFPNPVLNDKGKEIQKEVRVALAKVKHFDLEDIVTWRTKTGNISHNKFMVLLDGVNPIAVWTGSTNITPRGIFAQSNVGHIVRDAEIAKSYFKYWSELKGDPKMSEINDATINISEDPEIGVLPKIGTTTFFSPRPDVNNNKTPILLEWYADLIVRIKKPPFLTLPFNLISQFENILTAGNRDYLFHVIMEDGQTKKVNELNALNPLNQLAYGTSKKKQGELENILFDEIKQPFRSAFYVHTKYLIINPLSDDPIVVTGSANFSNPSIFTNDENALVIRGDLRVADIYFGEFMRLFRHFYYRDLVKDINSNENISRIFLNEHPSNWVPAFYRQGTAKEQKRLYFTG